MKVIFSDRAYASVLAETTEKIKTETGGLFLGTVKNDIFYIIEAIDPGPKSIFEVAYFEYDQKYTQHLINKIANLYNKKLDLIGLWHRHPGSFDQFSSTDDGTNAKYAAMRKEGAISALVNIDPQFRITMYHVVPPHRYSKISYEVGNQLIPSELLMFKTPDKFFDLMNNLLHPTAASRYSENGYHKSVSLASFMKFILPALEEERITEVKTNTIQNNEEMQERLVDELIDDLTFMADTVGVETSITMNDGFLTVYQDAVDGFVKLYFMFSEIKQAVILSYDGASYLYHRNLFMDAYKKEKTEREKNISPVLNILQTGKQNGVIDSVFRMIKNNRNEE